MIIVVVAMQNGLLEKIKFNVEILKLHLKTEKIFKKFNSSFKINKSLI